MASLSSEQASDLANQFLAMAQAIGDFRLRHWSDLTTSQHDRLSSLHWSVLHSGEDMLASSTTLVLNDASQSLASLQRLTAKMKSTLSSLKNIQKGFDLAASAVTLSASILSRNPSSIEDAIEKFADQFKKAK